MRRGDDHISCFYRFFNIHPERGGEIAKEALADHALHRIEWINMLKDPLRSYGQIDDAAVFRVAVSGKDGKPLI